MQYLGGKNYTIKRYGMGDFWRTYLATTPVKRFVDVCCGGGAVSAFIGHERPDVALVCNDIHPAAVAVLRGVAREGWVPPSILTEAEHAALRERAKAGEVSPLIGFAGFACSFAGQYFSGYARPRPATPNPVAGQAKTLTAKGQALARAEFHNLDYASLPETVGVLPGDVWYIDKPYAGTAGYKGTPDFDEARFWPWAQALAERVPVLISEFNAPEGWAEAWAVKRKMESSGGRIGGTQRECIDRVFCLDRGTPIHVPAHLTPQIEPVGAA